jgi:Ca2+:H+ antiporter
MVITTSNVVEQSAITKLSIFVAVILIVVYGLTLCDACGGRSHR